MKGVREMGSSLVQVYSCGCIFSTGDEVRCSFELCQEHKYLGEKYIEGELEPWDIQAIVKQSASLVREYIRSY